jgi:lipoprotein-anchoring transpeptidase ErfK/SrfK
VQDTPIRTAALIFGFRRYPCHVASPSTRFIHNLMLTALVMLGVIGMASVMLWPSVGVGESSVVANAAPQDDEAEPLTAPSSAPSPTASVETAAEPDATAGATAEPTPTPTVKPKKPKKPKPATRDRKAKHVPDAPRDKNTGRRIVYDKALMTVWLVNKKDEVVGRFPVVGRWDRPVKGEYKIYSKSPSSRNIESRVTFNYMTRFAYGNDNKTPIGFHDIPKYSNGKMMHGLDQLGLPIARGGCVRMAPEDAKQLYKWAKIGDRVIVLPAPS